MRFFKLPDLGEGLHEAEIVEWHIKAGDKVKTDQIIVSVETAKAIVDVPSPQDGEIAALFGKAGDMIHIGEPLVEFAGEHEDSGTVVGKVEQNAVEEQDHFIIGSRHGHKAGPRATPAIRALAARLGVSLNEVTASGPNGLITTADIEKIAKLLADKGQAEPLKGVRRSMALAMTKAHAEVVKVTVQDEVEISHWHPGQNPTVRMVRAIVHASQAEPALNAWYDGSNVSRRLLKKIDIGIAVDTEDGLFVPVLRDAAAFSEALLRNELNRLINGVKNRSLAPAEFLNPSISLSNFGTIAGKYADPVVVPPCVAIIGVGHIFQAPVVRNNEITVGKVLPVSLSFDHRACTGGEAARFLKALMEDLQRSD
ncbi:MAG TPA: dihydrolipoamide acetyltransferase family protein [Pseudomonadales bacterium]|nr:dihydrolipoamide acetyltransferase family protein [Pseudomonadales bacterium]